MKHQHTSDAFGPKLSKEQFLHVVLSLKERLHNGSCTQCARLTVYRIARIYRTNFGLMNPQDLYEHLEELSGYIGEPPAEIELLAVIRDNP